MQEKEQILQEIISNMSAVRRLMWTCMQQAATDATRLPASQSEVLFWVHQQGSIGLKSLAETMQITPGAITQLVESLEKSGLVARKPSPTDRRATLVDITPKGVEILSELHKQKMQVFEQAYRSLEIDELRLMNKIQKKIISNMENHSKPSKEKE